MSAYYEEPIQCPECGYMTSELHEATSKSSGQKVLMCEGCYMEGQDGEWDETWTDPCPEECWEDGL